MAPLPDTNTARLVIDYTWRGDPHTITTRWSSENSQASAVSVMNTLLGVLDDYAFDNWTVPGTGIGYESGSPIGFPAVGITPRTGGVGVDPGTRLDAMGHQFVGRSLDGRRWALTILGLGYPVPPNQRVLASADAAVFASLSAFATASAAGLATISGEGIFFKAYVNVVVNDYLTQLARRG